MPINKRFVITFLVFCVIVGGSQSAYSQNLIEQLAVKDSVTNATVKVYQDKRIESLVLNKSKNTVATEIEQPQPEKNTVVKETEKPNITPVPSVERIINGYRVQVFSSNEQKTAKNEAYQMQEQLLYAFPDVPANVIYAAPNWKVRIGNCRTREEAQALRKTIRDKFPDIKDIYVVPDKVKVR